MGSLAELHDAYAADYDSQVQAYGCYLAEALFGLCYEFIQPHQSVLDVGIGSGLSAALFTKAGLLVHGMDFSPAMLALCRARAIAVDLQQHDVQTAPWPYPNQAFAHVICCGVIHFLPDLDTLFHETERVLLEGGLFAFTTKSPASVGTGQGNYERVIVGGMDVHSHAPAYVQGMVMRSHCAPLRTLRCFVGQDPFDVWLVRKQ